MPQNARRIFFWQTPVAASGLALAERLNAIAIAVAQLRQTYRSAALSERQRGCSQALDTARTTLADLLRALDHQNAALRAVQSDLAGPQTGLLASWRVTEREILATEATALKTDLETLYGDVRRMHVDLAGALMDLA